MIQRFYYKEIKRKDKRIAAHLQLSVIKITPPLDYEKWLLHDLLDR